MTCGQTMAYSAIISFRDQATGKINDLLGDEGLICGHTQNLLSYLSGALLSYKEEGVELTPTVLLCESIGRFLTRFPGSSFYQIGSGPLEGSPGKRILKECAPLSGDNWFVYVERITAKTIRFGVFTYSISPTSVNLLGGLSITSDQMAVLAKKVGENTIELVGGKGSRLKLMFSTSRDAQITQPDLNHFGEACTSSLQNEVYRNQFITYFIQLLDKGLSASHGTMLACSKDETCLKLTELKDAVVLNPPLDLFAQFERYRAEGSAESLLSLQRAEELLNGFMRCDGIVFFDETGRVFAYRVFYRPKKSSPNASIIGGARRRAFEGAKSLVPENLTAILFRSQDGGMELERKIDG